MCKILLKTKNDAYGATSILLSQPSCPACHFSAFKDFTRSATARRSTVRFVQNIQRPVVPLIYFSLLPNSPNLDPPAFHVESQIYLPTTLPVLCFTHALFILPQQSGSQALSLVPIFNRSAYLFLFQIFNTASSRSIELHQ